MFTALARSSNMFTYLLSSSPDSHVSVPRLRLGVRPVGLLEIISLLDIGGMVIVEVEGALADGPGFVPCVWP